MRILLLAVIVLCGLGAAGARAQQACCVAGECILTSPEACSTQLGVSLASSSCAGIVCVQCCDHFGPDENVCADHLPLGSCKNTGTNRIIPGGVCSNGSDNVGVCLSEAHAPTASTPLLVGLGAALAVAGWAAMRRRRLPG